MYDMTHTFLHLQSLLKLIFQPKVEVIFLFHGFLLWCGGQV